MPISVNDETGEVWRLDGDKWVPAKKAVNDDTGESFAYDGQSWVSLGKKENDQSIVDDAIDFANSSVSQLAEGITLGASGEIAAGLDAPFVAGYRKLTGATDKPFLDAMSEAYDDRLKVYDSSREAFEEAYPVTSTALEIGGGIAGVAAGGGLVQGASKVPQSVKAISAAITNPVRSGSGLLANSGRSMLSGGVLGGAYGFNSGEGGAGERLKNAGRTALIGGVTGAVAPGAVDLVGKGIRAGLDQLSRLAPYRQASVGARKAMEALVQDGYNPQQALMRVHQMGPEAALADLGPNVRQRFASAVRNPGPGRAAGEAFVRARQEGVRNADNILEGGQINRIRSAINDLIPENYYGALDDAANVRQSMGQNYNVARELSEQGQDFVDVAPLVQSLDDQIANSKGPIRTSLERVRGLLVDDNGNPEITINALHQAKMAIDDMMTGGAETSMGRFSRNAVRDAQDDLIDAIEGAGTAGQAYNQGRTGTAAAWRTTDALQSGRDFMTRGTARTGEDLRRSLSGMSQEQLDAFRVGAAQALREKAANLNVRSDATKKLYDIPDLEERILAAFGDRETFRRYINTLQNERAMFDTYASVVGGSQTAGRLADDAATKTDIGSVVDLAANPYNPMNWMRAGAQGARSMADRLATPEAARAEMVRILAGRDTDPLTQTFRAAQTNEALRNRIAEALTRGTVVSAN